VRTRLWLRAAWTAAILLLSVLGIQAFVGDFYRVSSPSMEPTIHTGEWVFVYFDQAPVRRGELVVIERAGKLVVKRAIGIKPEGIRIDEFGDIWFRQMPLRFDGVPRPLLPVFDSETQPIADFFTRGSTQGNPWSETADGWVLEGAEIDAGSQSGMMRYHPTIRDDVRLSDGTVKTGTSSVGDVVLECDWQALELSGRLRLDLIESGDTFVLLLDLGRKLGQLTIVQRYGNESKVLLEERLDTSAWLAAAPEPDRESSFRIRFANVDNSLTVRIWDAGGELQHDLSVAAPQRHFHSQDYSKSGISFGHRAMLGGEGCRLRLESVRLWRDLHYTRRGEFAVTRTLDLGPNELFLLGDNSASSRDCREWGPVHKNSVVGRASFVVWPPSAWRRIAHEE
jgi:hypothetical protein